MKIDEIIFEQSIIPELNMMVYIDKINGQYRHFAKKKLANGEIMQFIGWDNEPQKPEDIVISFPLLLLDHINQVKRVTAPLIR